MNLCRTISPQDTLCVKYVLPNLNDEDVFSRDDAKDDARAEELLLLFFFSHECCWKEENVVLVVVFDRFVCLVKTSRPARDGQALRNARLDLL